VSSFSHLIILFFFPFRGGPSFRGTFKKKLRPLGLAPPVTRFFSKCPTSFPFFGESNLFFRERVFLKKLGPLNVNMIPYGWQEPLLLLPSMFASFPPIPPAPPPLSRSIDLPGLLVSGVHRPRPIAIGVPSLYFLVPPRDALRRTSSFFRCPISHLGM